MHTNSVPEQLLPPVTAQRARRHRMRRALSAAALTAIAVGSATVPAHASAAGSAERASASSTAMSAYGMGGHGNSATTAVTRHVMVGGLSVAYRSFGHGPALVLTPCLGMAMDDWDPAFLDHLATQHTVVIYDSDGVARTPASASSTLTVADLADEAVGLIHALHLVKPTMLGYSLGGFIAQKVAVDHPGLLSALVLMGTSPGGPHEVLPDLTLNAPVADPTAPASELFPLYFSGHSEDMARWQQRLARRDSRVEVALPGLDRDRAALLGWLTDPTGDTAAHLPGITTPTLVLGAAMDQQEPVGNSKYIASVIPHARLIVYPGLGHAFPFEAPQRVASDINHFLDLDGCHWPQG